MTMYRKPEDVGKDLDKLGLIRSMVIADEFPHTATPAPRASPNQLPNRPLGAGYV